MDYNNFDRLVELYSSSILTPFNLIQYLKLDNYINMEVNKNNYNDRLIAKINFMVNEKEKAMYYEFDYDDKLLEVYSLNENYEKEYIYNRNIEERDLLNLIKNKNEKKAIV